MIQVEILSDGRERRYSDAGMCIRQVETGVVYEDAVDTVPCRYTYVETDIPLPVYEPEEQEE